MKPEMSKEALSFPSLEEVDVDKLLASAGFAQANVQEVLPATAGQTYMLSLWQQSAGRLFYPTFRYRLYGSVDTGRVRHAWNVLLGQHSILRTSFIVTGRERVPFIQVVRRDFGESFSHGDAEVGDTVQSEVNVQSFVRLHAKQREDHWLLSLTIHHALYDGVSLPLLIADLEKLCNSIAIPPPSNVPFRTLVASTSNSSARETSKTFWTDYLSDPPILHLPQPATAGSKRVEVFRPAAIQDVSPLEKLAKIHGLSIHAFFLAAYARTYANLLGESKIASQETQDADVIFGIYLANRSHAIDGSAVVAAPTVNLVPLRVRQPAETSVSEAAGQIQRDLQEIGGLETSTVGLWEIERWTGVKIDSFVNFLNLPGAEDNDVAKVAEVGADKQTVKIRELDDQNLEARSGVSDTKEGVIEIPGELKKNAVKDVYLVSRACSVSADINESLQRVQQSLDVEATVRDGALDVGVFCPEDMLEVHGAEKFIDEVTKAMLDAADWRG